MATVYFHEEQRFSPVIIIAAAIMLVVGIALLLVPWAGVAGISVVSIATALVLTFAVLKLVTEVRDDGLYVRLFPLPFRHFALETIASYQVRTYRPIREYGGWGLRSGFSGAAYNARGNRGVQLVLVSGRRVLIGSQQPEALEAAIAKAAAAAGRPAAQE